MREGFLEEVIPELKLDRFIGITDEEEVFRKYRNKGIVLKGAYFLWSAISRSNLKKLF